jgi:cytochrome c peroxidase
MNYKVIIGSICILIFSCKSNEKPFYFDSEEEFIQNNEGLSDSAKLGKLIFFDKNLSTPVGTSCATCHSPMNGFSDPRHLEVSTGALGLQGTRNSPVISYAVFAPNLHAEIIRGVWESVGGFFWDGRSEFLIQQSFHPLLNHQEMNNGNMHNVAQKLKNADYFSLYKKLFGKPSVADSQVVVFNMSICIEQFERSKQVNPFTSKFDFYLQGKYKLTEEENRGMQLFNDTTKAKCSVCHSSKPLEYASSDKILFTDYSYDNLGLPKNININTQLIDSGVAKSELFNPLEVGKFKSPTLRNVAISSPYMHSGIFKTLEEVLDFYNERDINPKFAHPEVPATINTKDLGNLKLTAQDKKDIIAFLNILTDGYMPVETKK